MNILELIADVIDEPEGAFERLSDMGVHQTVIDAILPLIIAIEEGTIWNKHTATEGIIFYRTS